MVKKYMDFCGSGVGWTGDEQGGAGRSKMEWSRVVGGEVGWSIKK